METISIKTEISKTKKLYQFVLSLSQRLDLKCSSEHVVLKNLSISYKWKNICHSIKTINLKFKIISNISLKNMKDKQKFLLFMFTSIELITD